MLSGPIESTAVANLTSSHMIVIEPQVDPTVITDDQLICALRRFWETESLEINLDESDTVSDFFYMISHSELGVTCYVIILLLQ